MKIQILSLHSYTIPLSTGQTRSGVFIQVTDEKGASGWGEIAPLPKWSEETLEEALSSLDKKQDAIMKVDWTCRSYLSELRKLNLSPATTFGLETALLAVLSPMPKCEVQTSALFMGTKEEILEQAMHRQKDGYTSAKLKVSNLNFDEAAEVIDQLKDQFRLRIDVNRAWTKAGSLHFFSQFALDAFDYVEEPFKNPKELREFTHPLAIDESFPADLSLHEMEELPTLKALIYKPTIQGGRSMCSFLSKWAAERKIDLVLSSSFETDLGLAHIAAMAHRFSLSAPVGIGTYHYLNELVCEPPLRFSGPIVSIPTQLEPSLFRESHRSTASK